MSVNGSRGVHPATPSTRELGGRHRPIRRATRANLLINLLSDSSLSSAHTKALHQLTLHTHTHTHFQREAGRKKVNLKLGETWGGKSGNCKTPAQVWPGFVPRNTADRRTDRQRWKLATDRAWKDAKTRGLYLFIYLLSASFAAPGNSVGISPAVHVLQRNTLLTYCRLILCRLILSITMQSVV